ncbi:p-loop NTPase [Drosophila innubila nudivirus]|uniref:p-loop NTPase n=1 Tax=Drosophila innubila nudivirus TaxID=2057187 RepID=A0A2H4UXD3_9VIRU|nr:p-loop NTPase [Drosophila innubila nudivirus]ATZ81574.1 p-loop NTPase [Drosophila innubila nudivirus]
MGSYIYISKYVVICYVCAYEYIVCNVMKCLKVNEIYERVGGIMEFNYTSYK